MKRWIITLGIVLLYGAFWRWYTGRQKPLTPQEIEGYISRLAARGGDDARLAQMRAFLEADTGRSFVIVNLIKLHENQPGRESAAAMLNRYTSVFLGALFRRAGHPLLGGKTASDAVEVWGVSGGERWSNVGVVRYRSRRDMMEAVIHPRFSRVHPFKQAAMEKTIAVPVDPWFQLGDPRLIGGLLALLVALRR